MQLVIIAGGLGRRLRPLTLSRPKTLIPLVDRPMVVHLLDALPATCEEVLIAVNYRFDQVRDFFRDRDFHREIRVIDEPVPLGTGGALKNLERHIHGPFAVYNGDVVDTLDFDGLVRAHRKGRGIGTIAVWPVDDPSAFGAVEITKDRIVRFVEKPAKGETASRVVNAGQYVFEPRVFDFIEAGHPVSLEREVFPRLIKEGLTPYRFDGWWRDAPLRDERHPRRDRPGDECGPRGQGGPRDRHVLLRRSGGPGARPAAQRTDARSGGRFRADVGRLRRDRPRPRPHPVRAVLRREIGPD